MRKRKSAFKSTPSKRDSNKLRIWDKDIICLPMCFALDKAINIPRGKNRVKLGKQGLIGKIRLRDDMIQEEIFQEIRSVFSRPMRNNDEFPFTFLQNTGGGAKTLTPVQTSSNWLWTAQQVARLGGQGAIYILADDAVDVASLVSFIIHYAIIFILCQESDESDCDDSGNDHHSDDEDQYHPNVTV